MTAAADTPSPVVPRNPAPLASWPTPDTQLTPEMISGYLNRFEALCEEVTLLPMSSARYQELLPRRIAQRDFLARLLTELAAARSLLREAERERDAWKKAALSTLDEMDKLNARVIQIVNAHARAALPSEERT